MFFVFKKNTLPKKNIILKNDKYFQIFSKKIKNNRNKNKY